MNQEVISKYPGLTKVLAGESIWGKQISFEQLIPEIQNNFGGNSEAEYLDLFWDKDCLTFLPKEGAAKGGFVRVKGIPGVRALIDKGSFYFEGKIAEKQNALLSKSHPGIQVE